MGSFHLASVVVLALATSMSGFKCSRSRPCHHGLLGIGFATGRLFFEIGTSGLPFPDLSTVPATDASSPLLCWVDFPELPTMSRPTQVIALL